MGIRDTEKRLPIGYSPKDLGESYSSEDETLHLISYLTSPITAKGKNTYVVFCEKVDEPEQFEFEWIVKENSTNKIDSSQPQEQGFLDYTNEIEDFGNLQVIVHIYKAGSYLDTLALKQEVTPLESSLEILLGNINIDGFLKHLNLDTYVGALCGDDVAARELINNFREYVNKTVSPTGEVELPLKFLAAIVYEKISQTQKEGWVKRDSELAAAAAELNNELSKSSFVPSAQYDNGLGVCSVTPQTLAMVLTNPETEETYIPWEALPSNEDKRDKVKINILKKLNNLSNKTKIDLFNLIRFPKTNILMCAKILRRLIDRDNRWPNYTSNELLEDENAMKIIATEYHIGGTSTPKEDAKSNDFGEKLINKTIRIPALKIYFADWINEGASAYGGKDLHRRNPEEFDSITAEERSHVQELKRDLRTLGFKIINNENGIFGRLTEWAVREFQIYSKMPYIAHKKTGVDNYLDSLEQTANILPYTGPISGVVNISTRVLIQLWKEKKWRCPLVIWAQNPDGSLFNNKMNIWKHDEVGDCHPDVYAKDFTGYYELSQHDNNLIGMHETTLGNGPVSLKTRLPNGNLWSKCGHRRNHPQVEVTPERLMGVATNDLLQNYSDPQEQEYYLKLKSTYKVVDALALVESVGYFDSLNAWDNAIISIGMYHWTLGRPDLPNNANERDGEMCAFLGLLKKENPSEFNNYFKKFGIDIDRAWNVDGQHFFNENLIKYAGWIMQQKEDYNFQLLERNVDGANYIRNWHWFYRITMAVRDSEIIQRLNWEFTRIRIRDILELRWENIPSPIPASSNLTLGDIYTSERSIALLLRGHVNYPARIVENGIIHNESPLRVALNNAVINNPGLNWSQTPENWEHTEEAALAAELLTALLVAWNPGWDPDSGDEPDHKSFTQVNDYQWDGEDLSTDRNSFKFYDNNLPQAPNYDT